MTGNATVVAGVLILTIGYLAPGLPSMAASSIEFQEYQSLPTNGSGDSEFFTINGESFLAINHTVGGANTVFKIYKWTGIGFAEHQSLAGTLGIQVADSEFFTVGGDSYLALAVVVDASSVYNTNSMIYKWDGESDEFVENQKLPTSAANDWEFFTVGADSFLAVANNYNGASHSLDSKIYKWGEGGFSEIQAIPTIGARDWEHFTVGVETFLVVANSGNNFTSHVDSKMYRWINGSFIEYQALPTDGALDWESFTIGSDIFLAVANSGSGPPNVEVESLIYRWEDGRLVPAYSLPTSNAYDWEFFTMGNDPFLALANYRDNNNNLNVDSKIYRFDGTDFVEHQSLPTVGARDWESFTRDTDSFLVVSNRAGDAKVYRAEGSQPPGSSSASVVLPLISGGPIFVECENVLFPQTHLAGRDVLAVAEDATWTATDLTNLGAGWHVTLIAEDHLRGDGDPDNRVIFVGEHEDFTVGCLDTEIVPVRGGAAPPTCLGTQPIPVLGENPITMIYADPGEGMGVYDFVPHFEIVVPGTTIIDRYTTAIFADIIVGP